MISPTAIRSRFVLPLPRFVLHPLTSLGLGAIHVYLALGHFGQLAAGDVQWTHIWKGFGALAGAVGARRDAPRLALSSRENPTGEKWLHVVDFRSHLGLPSAVCSADMPPLVAGAQT